MFYALLAVIDQMGLKLKEIQFQIKWKKENITQIHNKSFEIKKFFAVLKIICKLYERKITLLI